MTYIRRAILALVLIAGFSPAIAQVPPPVPALPDIERRTTYSISASTCACNVNFALYGDSADYANWIEVFVNGVRMSQAGNWTLSSVTGTIGSIPLPITNAVLTFTAPQTGTIQIVGARRPRRTSQFNEGAGVPTRNFNVVLSDLTAQNRELWDKTNDVTGRALMSQPGNTVGPLPLPSLCSGKYLAFDVTGLIPQCNTGGPGSGNVVGPGSSVDNDFALFSGTTGALLKDGGASTVIQNTTANKVWAGPTSGGAAAPGFRSLIGTDLPIFTSTLIGAVPASGGGIVNFLRADGTFAAVPGNLSGTTTVTGASTTYTSGQNNLLLKRSNSAAAMADTLPGTGPGILAANTLITIMNVDTTGIISVKVGAGAAFKSNVPDTGFVYICPGQVVSFYSDGANYQTTSPISACYFSADSTLFVATTGSNTNDGLTVSTPLLTIQTAWNLGARYFNTNGKKFTIQVADGTYTGNTYISGLIPGQKTFDYSTNDIDHQSSVFITGNKATPTNAILAGNGILAAINFSDMARVVLQGFQVKNTASSYDIYVVNAWLAYSNIDFGVSASVQLVANTGAVIQVFTPFSISGGSGCHFIAGQGGQIQWAGSSSSPGTPGVITLTGTPAFASGFACAQSNGSFQLSTVDTFSGTATGPRYNGSFNGTINVAGQGITYFPGNAVGALSTGAQYN